MTIQSPVRRDALLHPVGPLPAGIYWRRRAVVLAAVVALLVLVGVIASAAGGSATQKSHGTASATVGQGPSGDAAPSALGAATERPATPRPSTSGTATSGPETSAPASSRPAATSSAGTGACAEATLALSFAVGADSYPSGALPHFVVTVTNRAAFACTRDLGPAAAVITVVSGSDRIWSSGDCPSPPEVRTLKPGVALPLASSWDRLRSLAGCAKTGAAGQAAKPGVYVASVTLGSASAPGVVSFHLS